MLRLLVGFLRPRGRSVVLASVLALAVTGAHGCLPSSDCERLRSCAPSGGTPGIVEQWSGGRGPLGGGEGGAAGEGGMRGLGGWGGTLPEVPPVAPGDECAPNGLYACAGHATPDQLVCANGYFIDYDRCPSGQYCDTRPATSGLCQPVIPECEDHLPSDVVCRGTERLTCGPDLVTAESLGTCDDLCWEGKCVECSPDTPATCEFNSVRSCTPEGQWQVEPCDADTPHCSDGECGVPPSCLELEPTCGIDEDEACCASPVVTGGPVDSSATAPIISSFRLDRFEVTVGRFRAFREAWDAGWRPEVGSGKHAHLNGGLGLRAINAMGVLDYEPGWLESYVAAVNPTDQNLAGPSTNPPTDYATWTPSVGDERDEQRPINFVNAFEAYAFCIWDGGFLPAPSGTRYAARGGSAMRSYPWGNETPLADFELAVYGCYFPDAEGCTGVDNISPVGTARGESLFAQLDLAGNIAEWTFTDGGPNCPVDCIGQDFSPAVNPPATMIRGGAFDDPVNALSNGTSATRYAAQRERDVGFRCARSP